MKIFLIFPGHLFENTNLLESCNFIYIVEEYINEKKDNPVRIKYFKDCLNFYYNYLKNKFNNKIIKFIKNISELSEINNIIGQDKYIYYYNPVNYELLKKIKQIETKLTSFKFIMHETLGFITSSDDLKSYYKKYKTLRHSSFYLYQRKTLNILIDKNSKPEGGKLSYDSDNRHKLNENDPIIKEENNSFPINFIESKKWLNFFIHNKLNNFGEYQDAIISTLISNKLLYHSGISPMLNIGLLTPSYVLNEILSYYKTHTEISINNIEGFIRQIIGWREHCRLTYEIAYTEMKFANKLKGNYKIPSSWYSSNPNTGIKPLDDVIAKGWNNGYLHHIERLMVIGSFMLMIGIHPDEAYEWFFHMSCDSYDWNMINNVKIMALYAYPNLYTTKPYIASSNYILKMSNYKKDGIWDVIWDSLYWEFINKYSDLISKNGRMAIQIKYYSKKSPEETLKYKTVKKLTIKNLFLIKYK